MRACTAELSHDEEREVYCPHLNAARDERDGRWVNRVPYYYSAYQYGSVSINSIALADAHRVSLGLEPFPQEHSKKKSHAKRRLRELKLTLLKVLIQELAARV